MNILFVLSQIRVTGAETYVATLAKELNERGHKIFVISDTFITPFEGTHFPLSLDNRALFSKIKNIIRIKQIIKDEKIEVVHANSRASSWVGYFAAKLAKIPMVTTVHGIQRPHLSLKVFPCLGEYALVISENVREYIIKNFRFSEKRIKLIRNGIVVPSLPPTPETLITKRIASYISRTDGPKGKILKLVLREVLPEILNSLPDWEILIVGGDEKETEIPSLVQSLNRKFFTTKIKWLRFQKDLLKIFQQSDLVIGSGRVTIEAMAYGKPVLSLGEAEVYGSLNEKNFLDAQRSNFGDCGERKNYEKEELIEKFKQAFGEKRKSLGPVSLWCQKKIIDEYNIKKIASQIEDIYLELAKNYEDSNFNLSPSN